MTRRKSASITRSVAVASLFWGFNAHAQWKLTWEAPADCPRGEEVLAEMRDIVGEAIFEATALEADGRIREVDGGYRLELRIAKDDGPRVRSLDAKRCQDLLGASAVVLGLHVKRLAAERESGADTTNENPAGSTLADEPGAAPSDAPAATAPGSEPQTQPTNEQDPDAELPRNNRPRRWWLALPQAGVVIGSLPEVAPIGSATLGWRNAAWRVWVAGRYQFAQTVDATNGVPNVGVVVDKYSVELGVSHGWSGDLGEIALGVAGGVDHVVARGTGEDITPLRAQDQLAFVASGLTFRLLMTDWLSLAAAAVGEVPLSRPLFEVDALGAIGQFSPVHLRTTLGLEWNF